MKIFDIAIKDMTRSFRSAFALIFMFGVPLLMTGMFYFMFGGAGKGDQGFTVAGHQGGRCQPGSGRPRLRGRQSAIPGWVPGASMGEMILSTLQDKSFARPDGGDARSTAPRQPAPRWTARKPARPSSSRRISHSSFSDLARAGHHRTVQGPHPDPRAGIVAVRSCRSSWTACRRQDRRGAWSRNRPAARDPALIGQVDRSSTWLSIPAGDQSTALLDVHVPASSQASRQSP